MLDINCLRKETPGCADHIHFNNAGAALQTQEVYDAVQSYLLKELTIGGYEIMPKYQPELKAVRESIGKLINANADEIAITQSATDAWMSAFQAIPFEDGDTIICNEASYATDYLNFLRFTKNKNINIRIVPSLANGDLNLEYLEAMFIETIKLVALTHVPTNGGLVNPVVAAGRIIKQHSAFYLLDACQSVGQMPIDVKTIQCDFLSATGRKYLRAPRGTGFLYASRDAMARIDPQGIDLSGAEWTSLKSYELASGAKRFENFESNRALTLGLGKAVEYLLNIGVDKCYKRILSLAHKLRKLINDLSGYTTTDIGSEQCGIVTFEHDYINATEIRDFLYSKNIATSCTTPSGTLIDSKMRNLGPTVRASVHYYNNETEIEAFIKYLKVLHENHQTQ